MTSSIDLISNTFFLSCNLQLFPINPIDSSSSSRDQLFLQRVECSIYFIYLYLSRNFRWGTHKKAKTEECFCHKCFLAPGPTSFSSTLYPSTILLPFVCISSLGAFWRYAHEFFISEEMTKSALTSQHSGDSMAHLVMFKKLKRFIPLEPSLGMVSFFLISSLFIGCFFFLDYRAPVWGLHSRGVNLLGLHISFLSSSSSPLTGDSRPEFLDQDGNTCDVFDGNWVWDESYPLYNSTDCSFLDQGFRCNENGRPGSFYTKWRWQPRNCKLPRFRIFKFIFSYFTFRFWCCWEDFGTKEDEIFLWSLLRECLALIVYVILS